MTLEHFDTVFAFVVVIAGVSLLVTTLTQMASAFLGLRGTHLAWGLKTLLANLDPSLAEHAERISCEILHHPLVSDSTFSKYEYRHFQRGGLRLWLRNAKNIFFGRMKLASAIRKEELTGIIVLLAEPPAGAAPGQPVEPWRDALQKALKSVEPEATRILALAAPELRKLFPSQPAKADELLARMSGAAGQFTRNAEIWFDSVMDRVSQRFALHARAWTVTFSILVAIALQLDAIQLLQRISTDAELRARLITSADALTRKADEILVTRTNAPAAVYSEAMNQLLAAHTNQLPHAAKPGGFSSLPEAERWLTNQLATAGISDFAVWLREYQALVPGAKLTVAAGNLQKLLEDRLKFQLVPEDYPRGFGGFVRSTARHFWGIAASAVLLSLGAPFWFNLLKSLANLRPTLANKEEKEAKAKEKL